MLESKNYLPIGSVVLLKGGTKKIMVIGIMQSSRVDGKIVEEYDYIGVVYPEGFMNMETMVLFDHNQINDIIFTGFDNSERIEFLGIIDKAAEEISRQKVAQSEISDEA